MAARTSAATRVVPVSDAHALALHRAVGALLREFRLEPGLLAGSVYRDLHANDIGLFEILAAPAPQLHSGPHPEHQPVLWTVHRLARALFVPISTVSSALDRLEKQGLIQRRRIPQDRRVVQLELTARGTRLADRLRAAHVENCRAMLARLTPGQRDEFVRLAAQLAATSSP